MITIKTDREIKIMAEGGKKLARVKDALARAVAPGVRASEIEELAMKLIKEEGAEASFAKVPGYKWATCINVNEGLVHGIPSHSLVFKSGDVVSVDVGVYYQGFHTDTSVTVGLDLDSKNQKFLEAGREALEKAINKAKVGNYVFDISKAIESSLEASGYTPIKALVGHGVGHELHEDPQIPCFIPRDSVTGKLLGVSASPKIEPGMVFAIEVMYTQGDDKVVISEDGWTILMRDGKISALFEDTVAVTQKGSLVLTR